MRASHTASIRDGFIWNRQHTDEVFASEAGVYVDVIGHYSRPWNLAQFSRSQYDLINKVEYKAQTAFSTVDRSVHERSCRYRLIFTIIWLGTRLLFAHCQHTKNSKKLIRQCCWRDRQLVWIEQLLLPLSASLIALFFCVASNLIRMRLRNVRLQYCLES